MSVDIGTSGPIRILRLNAVVNWRMNFRPFPRNWVVGLHKYWVDNNLISPEAP